MKSVKDRIDSRNSKNNIIEQDIDREVYCGILPATGGERKYGFVDAFLVLAGYCIATWSYTQGTYLATLVGFKQLVIGAFFGALLMLLIYQLPVILSVRYGIDIWIWLRSVFGTKGVKVMTVVIIVINFPWYAVCCDLFASSMRNLLGIFGIQVPDHYLPFIGLICVIAGTVIALRGVNGITWTTRILVPVLLAVGVFVVIVGFRAVPFDAIWNYVPDNKLYGDSITPYILSIEANFAFVITLVGGMAGIPRLCKSERSGFYAGVFGQGLAGSFFVVVGAVMGISMNYVTGEMIDDPTLMMARLATPALGLTALLLVAFANIGTQAVGSYIYGVMLKSTFKNKSYRWLVIILAVYVGILCLWGKITQYFGAFLTISACIYSPLAALLFVDFFFVRKQKLDLRSAFELKGHNCYEFTGGFNIVGFICLILGMAASLLIYNPVTGQIYNELLFKLTPTGFSFIFTGILYYLLSLLPPVRRYIRKDTAVNHDATPFDRKRVPPRFNIIFQPIVWLLCYIVTRFMGLRIKRGDKRGTKPPYLVFGTHQSFNDFIVTPLAMFPHRCNYVSELEGFEYYGEWFYRQIGCLGTRKFIDDVSLIKNVKRVLERGDSMVIYPEARYANVGTHSQIPIANAKMVKWLKYPVVIVNMKGNYLRSPIWNLKDRKQVKLEASVEYVLTREEIEQMSVQEIHKLISEKLQYDEYEYLRSGKFKITDKDRAEGLHRPLYQCMKCNSEYTMDSRADKLFCKKCSAVYHMGEDGTLHLENGKEIYIPDWYEWERKNVISQVENGSYRLDMMVRIEALPNAVNFIPSGDGHLIHDANGYSLEFTDYRDGQKKTMKWTPEKCYSVHTEYDYRGQGQCITLSTYDDTYFLYPKEEGFNATKIQFATEYMYMKGR